MTAVDQTGAGRRATAANGSPAPAARTAAIEEIARLSPEDFDALVRQRLVARSQLGTWRSAAIRAQATARVGEVAAWPPGRRCPLGRLREAWLRPFGVSLPRTRTDLHALAA